MPQNPLNPSSLKVSQAHRVWLPPYAPALVWHRLSRRCVLCWAKRLRGQHLVCAACLQTMKRWQAPMVLRDDLGDASFGLRLYAAAFYQYPVSQLMSQFKQQENLSAFLGLLSLIYQLPKPQGCHAKNTAIVPVPTTTSRLTHRGFNPVVLLARHLAYHWGLPIWQGVARHETARQRHLNKEQRLANMQDGFYLTAKPPVGRLILFDDVVTTGATLLALSKTLQTAHPQLSLLGICVAHGSEEFHLAKQGGRR